MREVILKLLENVLTALYQPFWCALIIAALYMLTLKKYTSFKHACQCFISWFKESKSFRKMFYLAFYSAMILFRTVLNRKVWQNPLKNIIGVWELYDADGNLTTESLENLALFIPFTILLLINYREKLIGSQPTIARILWHSTKIVFLFSFTIEMLQLFLRLGTWQLSDLFYNTLGGFVGGFIYWIGYKVKKGRNNHTH